MTTTAAIIAAGEARAKLVATLPRTQLIRGVDMDEKITWGPDRKHNGSGDCPAEARDVPCMIIYAPGDTCGESGLHEGKVWLWEGVTAYRLPADVPPPADPVRDALVAAVDAMLQIRAVWTDPHNDAVCQKARAAIALAKGEKL